MKLLNKSFNLLLCLFILQYLSCSNNINKNNKSNYLIYTSTDGNGTISSSRSVEEGQDVTISVFPKNGYILNTLLIDDEVVESKSFSSYTFTNVVESHTIHATFKEINVMTFGLINGGINGKIENVKNIAAGAGYTIALRNDGTVIGWGNNNFGQTNIPKNLKNVIKIVTGFLFSVALKSDGTIEIWGKDILDSFGMPINVQNELKNVVDNNRLHWPSLQ